MNTIETLLAVADAYKRASGVEFDRTVSHRVFGDSKKLSALRAGSDITIKRYNAALVWFAQNWPEGIEKPPALAGLPSFTKDAA
ncbi:hypothetical protein [Sulfitobacter faviae]|uniref:hypothetical protein n=1 Tax=Sulfitobacter faviae TaxID=1775881 RepID=UPI0024548FA6|nr:hypothetical protein [Sulfitobacter faviae]